MRELSDHRAWFGSLPDARVASPDIVGLARDSGLIGRGGAALPLARKLDAVSGRHPPGLEVVVNAPEGDPTSVSDAVLAARAPHLVLSGAVLGMRAVGGRRVLVAVHPCGAIERSLRDAGHGLCAQEFSERIELHEWGYPTVDGRPT